MFRPLFIVALIVSLVGASTDSTNCAKDGLCQQEYEKYHVEQIKQAILSQLHMDSPPEMDKLPSAELRAEYAQLLSEIDNEPGGKVTETMFIPAHDPSGGEDESELIATFDVKDGFDGRELVEARLIFHVDLPDEDRVENVHVRVFEKYDDGELGTKFISAPFAVSGTRKMKVNLPVETVTKWYTTSPIAGIFVSALVHGHNVAVHPQQTTVDFENMILQLTFEKNKERHRRSSLPICSAEKPSAGCCLYDLMIDFEKIGWTWIVAPLKYNAYVCRGDCKLNQHHFTLSEKGHSKVMNSAHRMSEDVKQQLENVGMCCHPTEYDYLKMIYVNREGTISTTAVHGMIARRCSCS